MLVLLRVKNYEGPRSISSIGNGMKGRCPERQGGREAEDGCRQIRCKTKSYLDRLRAGFDGRTEELQSAGRSIGTEPQ